MNSKNSKQHWNEIYTKNLPEEVSWFQKEPTISLEMIQRVGNNKSRIIDVGGGASTLAGYLLKNGYSNVGVCGNEVSCERLMGKFRRSTHSASVVLGRVMYISIRARA